MEKSPSVKQETCVQPLGQEDPWRRRWQLSSILDWEIPWRGVWWAAVHGVSKELDVTLQLNNNKLEEVAVANYTNVPVRS